MVNERYEEYIAAFDIERVKRIVKNAGKLPIYDKTGGQHAMWARTHGSDLLCACDWLLRQRELDSRRRRGPMFE